MIFNKIPEELRLLPQWVVWRPDKRPFCARTGFPASVTNRNTWSTFDEAKEAFNNRSGQYAGIGFVFTVNDPYCGIDLDDPYAINADSTPKYSPDKQAEIANRHQAILAAFNSYAELSPSGNGAHIIIKASIPSGARRDSVEIYDRERYFTMTGNVVRNAPIAECHEMARQLCEEMGGDKPSFEDASQFYSSATESDDEVFNRASSGSNGDYFRSLWNGDSSVLSGGDTSGSAIDQALSNWLQKLTKDPKQIKRMILASPHGQNPHRLKKLSRKDYLDRTINRAFDWDVPLMGISAIMATAPNSQTTTSESGFPVFDVSELAGKPVPSREWLVDGIIPARQVALLYGDGGTGKSLLALQLAASAVLGRPWLGLDVQQGSVVFLTAEDDQDEVHRRIADIARAEGVELGALKGLHVAPLADRDAVLAGPTGKGNKIDPTLLFAALEAHIAAHKPSLLVLDTLADIFGGEENHRVQARQFIAILRGLAIRYRASILVLAHPSLTGMNTGTGTSGSTAWSNSVRSRLYFAHANDNADADLRSLQIKKTNYGRIGREFFVRWENGRFVVVAERDASPQSTAKAELEAEQLFLTLLANFTARGQIASDNSKSPYYAPKLFAIDPAGKSCKKPGYETAMARLFSKGMIRNEQESGPTSRHKKTFIVAVENMGAGLQSPLQPYPDGLQTPLQ